MGGKPSTVPAAVSPLDIYQTKATAKPLTSVGKVRKVPDESEDLPFFALSAYGTMGKGSGSDCRHLYIYS